MNHTVLARITRQSLEDLSAPLALITKVKYLSSYNWIEAPTPTIAVPGIPPLWTPLIGPQQLQKDPSFYCVDQNATRWPNSPLEPLFRALYIADPAFDIRSINLVTDLPILLKLQTFINPGSYENGLKPFAIHIEIVENTALFDFSGLATHVKAKPQPYRGFGSEFEKAYTTNQISDSISHYRIISYHFGGLKFIVRHLTDGYIDTKTCFRNIEPKSDRLSEMTSSLPQSSTDSTLPVASKESKLIIKEIGYVVPPKSLIEIKTRSWLNPFRLSKVASQLWAMQTHKLATAYHDRHLFFRPEIIAVTHLIKEWEKHNQQDLRKLATLIRRLLDLARSCGGNCQVQYDSVADELLVRTSHGKKLLPEVLYSKWTDNPKDVEAEINIKNNARAETPTEKTQERKEHASSHFSPETERRQENDGNT